MSQENTIWLYRRLCHLNAQFITIRVVKKAYLYSKSTLIITIHGCPVLLCQCILHATTRKLLQVSFPNMFCSPEFCYADSGQCMRNIMITLTLVVLAGYVTIGRRKSKHTTRSISPIHADMQQISRMYLEV